MTDMRVVLVAHNSELFGAERSLLSLAQGLREQLGFAVLVLVPREGPLATRCRAADVEVAVGCYQPWTSRRRRLRGVVKRSILHVAAQAQLATRIRRFAPDVIYTATGTTPFGAALARRFGVPHVWHLREFGLRDYGLHYDWGRRRSWRYLAAHADRVVANAEAVKNYFAPRTGRTDIVVIYNGFDFDPPPMDDPANRYREQVADAPAAELLLLGALLEGKGQHDAVRALAELATRGRRLRLVLAGDGNPAYADRLRRMAEHYGLQEQIEFAGFVREPAALYRRAAATLICSRCEGFGRTAVESLSHGTPVIGTDAGGLPEILHPEGIGLLYRPGDWNALADRIETLLDDRERYIRIAAAGPVYVRRRFARQRYIHELGALLEDTVHEQKAPVAAPGLAPGTGGKR